MPEINPIRETTEEARELGRGLIARARFGSIGVIDPESAMPMVTRVAIGQAPDGTPLSLISDLSSHTAALKADPRCSLLIGEPEQKGDPLTHPRLTLQCHAHFIAHTDPAYKEMRGHYLTTHPKAKLYIDFTDFSFALFAIQDAYLNGGFGKAFRLTPADLI